MEEKLAQHQKEMEMLRRRLNETESKTRVLRGETVQEELTEGGGFMQRLLNVCYYDSDMVKSMDLDKSVDIYGDKSSDPRKSRHVRILVHEQFRDSVQDFPGKGCLTTVFEKDEIESDDYSDEVQKEVIEEKAITDVERCVSNNASSRQRMIQNILTICGASEIVAHFQTVNMSNLDWLNWRNGSSMQQRSLQEPRGMS